MALLSIHRRATIHSGTLEGFRTSRDGLRRAKLACAHAARAGGWHLKVFRHQIPRGIVEQALDHVEADVAAGLWELPVYDLVEVYCRAESISRQHTAIVGARSLDILHVAAAIILEAPVFITDDDRQAELARATGLRVTMLHAHGKQR